MAGKHQTVYNKKNYTFDTLKLYDPYRNRQIPVAVYKPKIFNQKTVIVNHGYGQNKGGDYLAYTYITETLAAEGYFVISIQHELSTDSLLPLTGNAQIVRRPFWERGADNILFVLNELKQWYPENSFTHISLFGHSNCGDMVALFPQKYPGIVEKIITLDNRRMALPKASVPKVLSLRSIDQLADEGVLPTVAEQEQFEIKIIKLSNTLHNDMDDNANNLQRKEITDYILSFLHQ